MNPHNLFIDITRLPNFTKEYVAWIDIMGTKNIFSKTDRSPSLYILQFHKAVNLATYDQPQDGYTCYPVIDGLYLTTKDKSILLTILTRLFRELACFFMRPLKDDKQGYRFMVRAGLAYGKILHGESITGLSNNELGLDKMKKNALLFGKGMIDAYLAENGAPPFSIKVHEGSLGYYDHQEFIYWFNQAGFNKNHFIKSIKKYYAWLNDNQHWQSYSEAQKKQHLSVFLKMMG